MNTMTAFGLKSVLQKRIPDNQMEKYLTVFGGFLLEKIECNEHFSINYPIEKQVVFTACVFGQAFVVSAGAIFNESLEFDHCVFRGKVSFWGGQFKGKVVFKNCTFIDPLVEFRGGIFFDELEIQEGYYRKLLFKGGEFTDVIIGSEKSDIHIHHVDLNCSDSKGSFYFNNITCYEFEITGIIGQSDYVSVKRSSSIHFFIVKEFTNRGKFRISHLESIPGKLSFKNKENEEAWHKEIGKKNRYSESAFILDHAVLEKTELISVDFSEHHILSIRESSLIDIILSNVTWPKRLWQFKLTCLEDKNFDFSKIKEVGKDQELLRENYRQLKFASSKQGDVVDEQYFYGREMTAYERSLLWKSDFWTKLIVRLSFLTSNYGQSILLPLIWLLGGHFVLLAIALSIGDIQSNSFGQGVGQYFFYINPLRKIEGPVGGSLMAIDLIMRIWSSYMLYNIVRASRRFIK